MIGQAVGFSAGRAFVWGAHCGMRDLNDLIGSGQGITLTAATDINDQGAIVTWGTDPLGHERSFLLTPPPIRTVHVDIRPRTCPNPLNTRSRGRLPVAVLGSADFDVTWIGLASLRLAGVPPIHSSYRDEATPASTLDPCDCTAEDPDRYIDLALQFSTEDLVERLVSAGEQLVPGRLLTLKVTAVLFDDTRIEGADCVIIHGREPKLQAPVDRRRVQFRDF